MADRPTEHWYEKAADAMVREGKTLLAYSNEANLGMTSRECENIVRTKAFQEVLRTRRNVYYKEVANDPTLSRASMKGLLAVTITKMMENGQYDKAATAIMQFAKLEGWTADGTNVNVFADLTAADLNKLREKFKPVAKHTGSN